MNELLGYSKNFFVDEMAYNLYKLHYIINKLSKEEFYVLIREYCEYKKEQRNDTRKDNMFFDEWIKYKNILNEDEFPSFDDFIDKDIYENKKNIEEIIGEKFMNSIY